MYVYMYVCMYMYMYVCRPLTHRGQVYQQLTYVLAGRFLAAELAELVWS